TIPAPASRKIPPIPSSANNGNAVSGMVSMPGSKDAELRRIKGRRPKDMSLRQVAAAAIPAPPTRASTHLRSGWFIELQRSRGAPTISHECVSVKQELQIPDD